MLRITNPAVLRGIALREAQCVLSMQDGDLAIVARDPAEELLTGTLVERKSMMLWVIGENQNWLVWPTHPDAPVSQHWDTVRVWILTTVDCECVVNTIADRLLARPRDDGAVPVPVRPSACPFCSGVGLMSTAYDNVLTPAGRVFIDKCHECDMFATDRLAAAAIGHHTGWPPIMVKVVDAWEAPTVRREEYVQYVEVWQRWHGNVSGLLIAGTGVGHISEPPGERLRPLEFDDED